MYLIQYLAGINYSESNFKCYCCSVKENEQLDPGKFMELKTSRVIEHERQDRNFRYVTKDDLIFDEDR